MAKDEKDPGTLDAFPKKKGRPALKATGPMTSAERKARSRRQFMRQGLVERNIRINVDVWESFLSYCESHEKDPDTVLTMLMVKEVKRK